MSDSDDEPTGIDPTLYAILQALKQGRREDAIYLADALVEERGQRLAVLEMALLALALHEVSPGMPLGLMSTIGSVDGDSIVGADIADEFLDVVQQLLEDPKTISAESRAILDRYALRPGSPKVVEIMARVTMAMLSDLRVQLMLTASLPTPAQAEATVDAAIKRVRDEFESNRPPTDD